MASEIHEIEIARRLSSGTHLFIPPATWNLTAIGSAAHLAHLIQSSGRNAKVVAHPNWIRCIPDAWPKDIWILPEEGTYHFEERPEWTWLWGLSHSKQHSQELNNFLLGLNSIQILDWTSDRVRRRGQFYHDTSHLGGLLELSFVISRDLWPVHNWDSPCLGDGLRHYMQLYPMTCLDAPLMIMAGKLDFSELPDFELPDLAELRRHGEWSFHQYKNLNLQDRQVIQSKAIQIYQKESAQHLILALEDELGNTHFQVMTPNVGLELKLRKCLLEKIAKHVQGGFTIQEVDDVLACVDLAIELADKDIKKVKPWPSSTYVGEHFSFNCSDPQWEFERDQRLMMDEVIEEDAPEDEEEEEAVIAKLDWNANQLIQRLKHLKLPAIKLRRRDLVVSHLPILTLEESDLKETQDRLEEERQEALREQMRLMLEAEEERARLAAEKLEAEKRERELEAEKIRLAKAAEAQAEAQRIAEEEQRIAEAEAEQIAKDLEEKEAEELKKLEAEEAELLGKEEKVEAERKNDYLHSGKDAWGAEEAEEKDESEELLESFQELDRDHPVEEKEFYDDEEKLDDSMGIEHPSFEMFGEEEKEDELLEQEKDDLEAEQILAELEREEKEAEEESVFEKEEPEVEDVKESSQIEEANDKELSDESEKQDESSDKEEIVVLEEESAEVVEPVVVEVEDKQDDYLHSGKDAWGAEEAEEKDESEELLESFQELDRDHPVEEKEFYDDEEKLDDSMGIEHPSFEMFGEEEKDESDELSPSEIISALEENEEKLDEDVVEEPNSETREETEINETVEVIETAEAVVDVAEEVSEPESDEDEEETLPESEVSVTTDVLEAAEIEEESSQEIENEEALDDPETSAVNETVESVEIEAGVNISEDSPEEVSSDLTEETVDDETPVEEEVHQKSAEVEDVLEDVPEEERSQAEESAEVVMTPEAMIEQLESSVEIIEDSDEESDEPEDEAVSINSSNIESAEIIEESDEEEFDGSAEPEPDLVEPELEVPVHEVGDLESGINIEDWPAYDPSKVVSNEEKLPSPEIKQKQVAPKVISRLPKIEEVAKEVFEPKAAAVYEEPESDVEIKSKLVRKIDQTNVVGRKTATGYINPYIWDHHSSVNEMLTEVRQSSKIRKSDFAYVALVAVVLVWAHLNQLPFI